MLRYDQYDDDGYSREAELAPSRRWLVPLGVAVVVVAVLGWIGTVIVGARVEAARAAEAHARDAAIAAQQAEVAARQADPAALGANKGRNRAEKANPDGKK